MTIREELDALIAKLGDDHALLKARLQHACRETFGTVTAQDDSGDNTPPPGHP